MEWQYKGETFKSIPFKFGELFPYGVVKRDSAFTEVLVYHPEWNKCFWISQWGVSGNGNRLKAYIEDVYTMRHCYVEARKLELVIRKI